MKSLEEFRQSNILDVILRYHNEGGSRDVDRLIILAYEDYRDNPHLRHIANYYLAEIRFFPPLLSVLEQKICTRFNLPECSVDLTLDNWCLRMEIYCLDKLKRTDSRANEVVANRKSYRDNLAIVTLKYACRKLRDLRELKGSSGAPSEKPQVVASVETPGKGKAGPKITDFFRAKPGPASKKKKLEENSKLPTPEPIQDQNKRPISEQTNGRVKPGPKSKTKLPKSPEPPVIIDETPNEAIPQEPQGDKDVEAIDAELKMRGMRVKPGPKSKKRAYLERVIRKEEIIKAVKIRPGPASKKAKLLKRAEKENLSNQENVPPPTQPTNDEFDPKSKVTPVDKPSTEPDPKARGGPWWLMKYGVYDRKRNIFYDPEVGLPPLPEDSPHTPSPEIPIEAPLPIPEDSPPTPAMVEIPCADFSFLSPTSAVVTSTQKPQTPTEADLFPPPSVTPNRRPVSPFISYSQLDNSGQEGDNILHLVLNKNTEKIFHEKLLRFPKTLTRVKELLVQKGRVAKDQNVGENHEEESPRENASPTGVSVESPSGEPLSLKPRIISCQRVDKSFGTASMDSVVTVIEMKRPSKSVEITSPLPTEIILCDPLATQQNLDTTQVSQNPLQTQEVAMDVSRGEQELAQDSEVVVTEIVPEIIEIEDEYEEMYLEILGGEIEAQSQCPKKIDEPSEQQQQKAESTPRTRARKRMTKQMTKQMTDQEMGNVIVKEEFPTPMKESPEVTENVLDKSESPAIDTNPPGPSEPSKTAFRYNALPLKVNGPRIKIARRSTRARKPPVPDIYTAIRYSEETEGTARGMDIEDASLLGSQELKPHSEAEKTEEKEMEKEREDIPSETTTESTTGSDSKANNKRRTLLSSLKKISEKQNARLQQQGSRDSPASAFSAHRVSRVEYKSDGKGNFYTDSCVHCSFSVQFTADGLRRVQLEMQGADINRHLLNLTQAQWKAFQRLLRANDEFEFDGRQRNLQSAIADTSLNEEEEERWGGSTGGGGGYGCIIKRALCLFLRTTPKQGVNVGAIRFSGCVGAKPEFLKRIPRKDEEDLNLTECLEEGIMEKLRERVKEKEKERGDQGIGDGRRTLFLGVSVEI